MNTEMGEYAVGAWLKIIKGCDYVDYNVRKTGGGLEGLNEIDVIGFNMKTQEVYLCEVITHLGGTLYNTYDDTIRKVEKKFKNLQKYANENFDNFNIIKFMLWAPIVPEGKLTEAFKKIDNLDFIINKEYTNCINQLREAAKKEKHDTGNPFFRALQILESLK